MRAARRTASSRDRYRRPQRAVRAVVTELERLDQRLWEIAASLTPATPLRGILECVCNDLLRDAIVKGGGSRRRSAGGRSMKSRRPAQSMAAGSEPAVTEVRPLRALPDLLLRADSDVAEVRPDLLRLSARRPARAPRYYVPSPMAGWFHDAWQRTAARIDPTFFSNQSSSAWSLARSGALAAAQRRFSANGTGTSSSVVVKRNTRSSWRPRGYWRW